MLNEIHLYLWYKLVRIQQNSHTISIKYHVQQIIVLCNACWDTAAPLYIAGMTLFIQFLLNKYLWCKIFISDVDEFIYYIF